MDMITAKDIMNPQVIAVPQDWSVQQLAEFFIEKAITGAPVLDADGRLVGVVSLTDIARYESESRRLIRDNEPHAYFLQSGDLPIDENEIRSFHIEDPPEGTVADIMTPMVFKVSPSTPVREIARMMVHGRIHRVLVVDGDEVVGILTALDLVKLLEA